MFIVWASVALILLVFGAMSLLGILNDPDRL